MIAAEQFTYRVVTVNHTLIRVVVNAWPAEKQAKFENVYLSCREETRATPRVPTTTYTFTNDLAATAAVDKLEILGALAG